VAVKLQRIIRDMTATAIPPQARPKAGALRSTIGRKAVMALTGVALLGFVIAHMAGNLQMFLPNGQEAMHEYAIFLRTFLHGSGIWIARGGLIVAAILHVWSAASLTLDSRAARPARYRKWEPRASTLYSRTMRVTGVLILLYVAWHLLDITFGVGHPDFVHLDPYHNLVAGFQRPLAAWGYVAAMIMLGMHLAHGIWSMLRTLGVSHPRYIRATRALAAGLSILITLGYISIPLAVQFGMLR
jgi:succinate dehydrogenase / fumarate reductase cytochrome b subunit